ncbi:hypothetical protein T492DRAFT_848584 [Pavlovales sp. CCMP2436]|nr:hypothetical protein T492DRAFT_848584 [Pavlovales sp. CCMP2436]
MPVMLSSNQAKVESGRTVDVMQPPNVMRSSPNLSPSGRPMSKALAIGTLVVATVALVMAVTALTMVPSSSRLTLDNSPEFAIVIHGSTPTVGPSPAISALKGTCAAGFNTAMAKCFGTDPANIQAYLMKMATSADGGTVN